jgi:hypothetical protein
MFCATKYEGVAPPVMWKLAQDDLTRLERYAARSWLGCGRADTHKVELVHPWRCRPIVSGDADLLALNPEEFSARGEKRGAAGLRSQEL